MVLSPQLSETLLQMFENEQLLLLSMITESSIMMKKNLQSIIDAFFISYFFTLSTGFLSLNSVGIAENCKSFFEPTIKCEIIAKV